MRIAITATVALAMTLGACGPSADAGRSSTATAAPLPAGLAYGCQGEAKVSVVYSGGTALVSFRNETWNMSRTAEAGRFSAQGRQWQVHALGDHEEGVLTALGAKPAVITRCSRSGPLSTVAASLAPALPAGACTAADLSIKLLGEDAGAGQRHDVFAVKNRGLKSCSVQGYPAVELLGEDGSAAKGVHAVQALDHDPHAGLAAKLQLEPGDRAIFYLHYTVVPSDDKPCARVERFRVTLPGGRTGLIPTHAQPCGGVVDLSPLRKDPGTKDGI
jgi:hypothetical protein